MSYFGSVVRTRAGYPVRARHLINLSDKTHEKHIIAVYAFGVTNLAAKDLASRLFHFRYRKIKEAEEALSLAHRRFLITRGHS